MVKAELALVADWAERIEGFPRGNAYILLFYAAVQPSLQETGAVMSGNVKAGSKTIGNRALGAK